MWETITPYNKHQ